MSEPTEGTLDGITYRLRAGGAEPLIVLLHGWGGDERVMWVLESALPPEAWVVSLRGLYEVPEGGYAWQPPPEKTSALESFQPAVERVGRFLSHLAQAHPVPREATLLVGFSQGAALAFALATAGDVRPLGVASLAGLLPRGDLSGLAGLPVFWAHGNRDDIVPVQRARADLERLRALGAQLTYCEDDVGHKVGVACMRALRRWLKERAVEAL